MDNIQGIENLALEVDEQHRELERLLEMLDNVVVRDETTKVRVPVLSLIVEYCSRHIQQEERLMLLMKHPDADSHCADHSDILNIISNVLENCERFGEVEWAEFSVVLHEKYQRHQKNFDKPLLAAILEN